MTITNIYKLASHISCDVLTIENVNHDLTDEYESLQVFDISFLKLKKLNQDRTQL